MSTIVYRDGVMAADTRAFAGFNSYIGTKQKIRCLPGGTLIGVSSNKPGAGEAVMDWYAKGCRKPYPEITDNAFTLLVVRPDGKAFYANDSFNLTGPLEAPYFSIGSGCDAALGAMEMGATAIQAAEIACKYDVWSDLPIFALTHQQSE